MGILDSFRYSEEKDLIFSLIYGSNIYRESNKTQLNSVFKNANVIEHIDTKNKYYLRLLNVQNIQLPLLAYMLRNQRCSNEIIWPVDIVYVGGNDNERRLTKNYDLFFNYNIAIREDERYETAILYSADAFCGLKTVYSYLMNLDKEKITWINRDIQSLIIRILEAVIRVNSQGYIFIDFDLNKLLIKDDGEICFDFPVFIDSISSDNDYWGDIDISEVVKYKYYPIEFIEPAVVLKKVDKMDYRTQNYSLAALLFKLMVGIYPYEGRLMDSNNYLESQTKSERLFSFRDYYKKTIFVFDEDDKSNSIGLFTDEEKNIELWKKLPKQIRNMFINSLNHENAMRNNMKDLNPKPQEWLNCFNDLGWEK